MPPTVVTTINGFTKVFVGTLIERAREIQQQEVHATQSLPSPPQTQDSATDPSTSMSSTLLANPNIQGPPLKDGYLGPLLPDHIREAFRRYRRDGEGGGAGVSGNSVGLGLAGSGLARTGGKRLFK